jgi:hypothetical protein
MDHGLWPWGHLPARNRFGKAGGKHRCLAAAFLSLSLPFLKRKVSGAQRRVVIFAFSPLSGGELKPRALRVVVYSEAIMIRQAS